MGIFSQGVKSDWPLSGETTCQVMLKSIQSLRDEQSERACLSFDLSVGMGAVAVM